MVESSSFKAVCARGLLVACLASIPCAEAAVELNKLSACDDIARLYQSLKTTPIAAGCRAPRGALERALVARVHTDASQICFQSSVPAPFLEGFTCAQPPSPTGASLVCFRGANLSEVRRYEEQYGPSSAEPTSKPTSKYLAAAAACSVSNGDSSVAAPTTASQLLGFVSRFEFGFITSLGRGRPTDSSIVHGYAATDPAIPGDVPSALEFVYMVVGAPAYSRPGERRNVGQWDVTLDDVKQLEDSFNEEMRKRRVDLMMNMTSFDLTSRAAVDASQREKLSVLVTLQKAIARSLEDEGFEAISDSDLKAKTGRNAAEIVQEISRTMPFGNRQNGPVKLAPTVLMLFNDKRPACTREAGGAIGAYLIASEPTPDARSDYGSVGFIVAGIGACSRSTTRSTRTYVDGLIAEATRQVMETLQSR
jgi:hypothetical protein